MMTPHSEGGCSAIQDSQVCAELSAAFYSDNPNLTGSMQSLKKLHHIVKSACVWHPFTDFLLDSSKRTRYVVFRGSNDVTVLLTKALAAFVPVSEEDQFVLHVHGGMWVALRSILPDMSTFLISHRSSFDHVIFTGHCHARSLLRHAIESQVSRNFDLPDSTSSLSALRWCLPFRTRATNTIFEGMPSTDGWIGFIGDERGCLRTRRNYGRRNTWGSP